MARFRLLAGLHVMADPNWEPTEQEQQLAKSQGRILKAPSVTIKAGQVIESATDLVAKCGANHFERLHEGGQPVNAPRSGKPGDRLRQHNLENRTWGDPTPENMESGVASAPHGQISTGHPAAVNTDGPQKQGPLDVDSLRNLPAPRSKGTGMTTAQEREEDSGGGEVLTPAQVMAAQQPGAPPTPGISGVHPQPAQRDRTEKVSSAGGEEQQPQQHPQPHHQQRREPAPANLGGMSLSELRKHADGQKIEVPQGSNREAVIKAIRQHHAS